MAPPTVTREYYFPQRNSFEDLTIRDAPIPAVGHTEVLVKIHAVSLQYRDLMVSDKGYPGLLPENLIPCSDMAGEILAIGGMVTAWTVGDRVCANFMLDHTHGDPTPAVVSTALGGYTQGVLTEYRTFPAHSLVKIPEHLSYREASTLPCAAVVAYNALMGPVRIKAGDTVLILGTGGVSTFGLQFAVAAGATVIVTSSSDEKLQIAKKLGAKHLVNYSNTSAWDEEVVRLTGGRGVDHVLEVGGAGTLAKSMKAVRMGGSVHVIGVLAKADQPLTDVVRSLIFKSSIVRGLFSGSVEIFNTMLRMMEANPETTRPVIDKIFRFEEAIQAYSYLKGQGHVGKIVIEVA